jgi:carbon monoxide dehydrogenase subunit G
MLSGEDEVVLSAPVAEVWRRLTDPAELADVIPGCQDLRQEGPDRYLAQVIIGVAGIRGTYDAVIELRDKIEPSSLRLVGNATGALGFGSGSGLVTLTPVEGNKTRLSYRYSADVGGKVASVGQRMLGSVTKFLIRQFFQAFEHRITGRQSTWRHLLARLGIGGGAS